VIKKTIEIVAKVVASLLPRDFSFKVFIKLSIDKTTAITNKSGTISQIKKPNIPNRPSQLLTMKTADKHNNNIIG